MSAYRLNGKESLGIEFGSTRIKAVLVDETAIRLPRAVIHGKIALKTVIGLIITMIFGSAFRMLIQNSIPIVLKNSAHL